MVVHEVVADVVVHEVVHYHHSQVEGEKHGVLAKPSYPSLASARTAPARSGSRSKSG